MSRFFRHDGLDFHYRTLGTGDRSVVFCHGLTGDVEHPQRVLREPPPGWRLVLFDCRFHGLTGPDRESDDLSFHTLAGDLRALMDHLGINSAVMGGISMGAGITARYAASHPERAEALALVRPAWTDQPHPPNLLVIEQLGDRLREMDGPEVLRRFQADPNFIPAAAGSAAAAETLRQQCIKPDVRERSLRLRAIPASVPLRREELSRLTMPALVIGNENDGTHPMPLARWWAEMLGERATFREVPSKAPDLEAHEAATRRHVWDFITALGKGASA